MTNREQEMLEEILLFDQYNKRPGFSASQVGKPYLQMRLSEEHPELKQDEVSKLLASRIGTAFHKHAELALGNRVDLKLEETLIEDFNDTIISGTSDIYDTHERIIYDHKTMQSWKALWVFDPNNKKHDEAIEEFIPQLSCLAWLKYMQTGELVQSAKIIVWVVDYKKPYIRKDGTSAIIAPQYFTKEIPIWSPAIFEDWLETKLAEVRYGPETHCQGCVERTWVYDYCPYKEVCPALNKTF